MTLATLLIIKRALCCGVGGIIIQPYYSSRYSFAENCFNGFNLGFLVGFTYPVSILFIPAVIVHKYYIYPIKETWRDVSLSEKKRMGFFREEQDDSDINK